MFRKRRRSRRLPLLAALLVAVAAAAAAAARSGRLRVPASVPSVPDALRRLPGPLGGGGGGAKPGHEDWSCACGARYRVSGIDRHRVYWPAGASEDQPVLGTECVECGRPLPA